MKQQNRLHTKQEVSYGVCDLFTINKWQQIQPPEVTVSMRDISEAALWRSLQKQLSLESKRGLIGQAKWARESKQMWEKERERLGNPGQQESHSGYAQLTLLAWDTAAEGLERKKRQVRNTEKWEHRSQLSFFYPTLSHSAALAAPVASGISRFYILH